MDVAAWWSVRGYGLAARSLCASQNHHLYLATLVLGMDGSLAIYLFFIFILGFILLSVSLFCSRLSYFNMSEAKKRQRSVMY